MLKKDKSKFISDLVYKLADLILTHNEYSKSEIQISKPYLSSRIHIIPHGNYIPFISLENNKKKVQTAFRFTI